ncbi:hypothetical protein TRL7639_02447 [Falsiruegeria litorea R37]|uniref:Uncharacterized protein n=1 Tax=Falsiruegeria litorea R37 TaxID=1200284 RepID=A0A1Y5SPD0_9RHOB|nr:hypothetical protein [Falsiruegeria litorea]SLN45326.1 hypothetical protein TRL7639_02447 [Falsiruegeria litorea R37]
MPRSVSLRLISAVLGVAGLVLPSAALAEMPVTYIEDNRALFYVSAPDFWQVRAGGARAITPPGSDEARLINRVIGFEPVAEQGVWVGFMSPNGVSTFAEAQEYLRNIGQSVVDNPTVDSSKPATIGGRRAQKFAGHGRRDGRAVNFTAVLIDLPGSRVAISLSVIEAGADPALIDDVNAIYASFRAAR